MLAELAQKESSQQQTHRTTIIQFAIIVFTFIKFHVSKTLQAAAAELQKQEAAIRKIYLFFSISLNNTTTKDLSSFLPITLPTLHIALYTKPRYKLFILLKVHEFIFRFPCDL